MTTNARFVEELDRRILEVLEFQWQAKNGGEVFDAGIPILERAIALCRRGATSPLLFIAIGYAQMQSNGIADDPRHETLVKQLEDAGIGPSLLAKALEQQAADQRSASQDYLPNANLFNSVERVRELENTVDDDLLAALGAGPEESSLSPVCPGSWRAPEEQDTNSLRAIATLRGTAEIDSIFGSRLFSPDFYPGASIVEIIGEKEGGPCVLSAVVTETACFALNGQSVFVHWLNQNLPLRLTDKNVADYLRFFCFATKADDGPFRVIGEVDEIPVLAEFDEDDRAVVEGAIEPVELQRRGANDYWEGEVAVLYSDALFKAIFHVKPSGLVEMIDDDPLVGNLPVAVENYTEDGLRQIERRITRDANEVKEQ